MFKLWSVINYCHPELLTFLTTHQKIIGSFLELRGSCNTVCSSTQTLSTSMHIHFFFLNFFPLHTQQQKKKKHHVAQHVETRFRKDVSLTSNYSCNRRNVKATCLYTFTRLFITCNTVSHQHNYHQHCCLSLTYKTNYPFGRLQKL